MQPGDRCTKIATGEKLIKRDCDVFFNFWSLKQFPMHKSILFFCLITLNAAAQDFVTSANAFLSSLDAKSKTAALYPLDDAERFNWHFVPRERKGACFRDFNAAQRAAGLSFLRASLGESGYNKTIQIMALENVLREIEGRTANDTHRDPLNYYITFFGEPSKDKPWGWRLEGHHIAFNFAAANNQIVSSTPHFFGSNPGTVPDGAEKGKQVLKLETDGGFALCQSLSAEQKAKAIVSEKAFPDIISFNSRKAALPEAPGISYKDLNPAQQKQLLNLLDVYVKDYQLGFSKTLMEKIRKAGIENLSFAWAGSIVPGTEAGNYYRIQGPMLLIEYDNTQNKGNHVHTTVRDLTNDFAEDILKEHYLREH